MQNPGLIPAARHGRRHSGWARQAGITLLELMMVMTIVAILGVIALPSYKQYSTRAHRTDAKTALLRVASDQERYYLQFHTYGTLAQLSGSLGTPALSEKGAYAVAVTAADNTQFNATATPVAGGQFDQTTDADCTQFSITSTGLKSATGAQAARCW